MTEIDQYTLFDLWVTRNFHYIGIAPEDFSVRHIKFRDSHHIAMVLLHSDRATSLFDSNNGLNAIKRASRSTGIHATVGKSIPVDLRGSTHRKIPFPINPLRSIDHIQDILFSDNDSKDDLLMSMALID